MRKSNKLLLSALVVGVLGSLVALGVFGLFSATTQNSGNEISSGTVLLGDNDAGSAEFNITGAKPGESWTRCIKVSYNGTLPAEVRSYGVGAKGPLLSYLEVKEEQGTQPAATFPSCTGFTPDNTNGNGVLYEGPIAPILAGSWEESPPIVPFGQTAWNGGDSLVMKTVLTLSPSAPDLAQGSTTGSFTTYWEARNK